MQWLGDFPEDSTVYIPFNTFTSNDPQASSTITNLADADIMVHKDGGLTQIATDGATVIIDFDGITGNHLITIDTSVHADYSIGSDYLVRIEGTTVDAGTINAWIGSFSIENRFSEVDVTKWLGTAAATPTTAGVPEVDITYLGGVAQSLLDLKDFADAGYDPGTNKVQGVVLVDTTTTNTDMVGTDNAATASALATAQNDLDTITGSDGVTLATAQGLYAPNVVVPDAAGVAPTAVEIRQEVDSNSTQLAAIVADTAVPVKNAVFNNMPVFMVDTTDDISGKTGLTLTVTRSIDGGAFGSATGTAAEIGNGMYQFDASAADMNGDVIIFRFASTGANDTLLSVYTKP